MSIQTNIERIQQELPSGVKLVAVTKNRSIESIRAVIDSGVKDLGENRVQELIEKASTLQDPTLSWHLIGHLQRNKVRAVLPFVHLIHSIDSVRLYEEVMKEAGRIQKKTSILLQVYIATEESKFGLNEEELIELLSRYERDKPDYLKICGLMGMASNTADAFQVAREFEGLHRLFTRLKDPYPFLETLSMGMSSDYKIALSKGSTLVRIGSALFDENE